MKHNERKQSQTEQQIIRICFLVFSKDKQQKTEQDKT